MNPGVAYIAAALLFGFAYPFLKQFLEPWQLVLIAVLYFAGVRFGYQTVARFLKGRARQTSKK